MAFHVMDELETGKLLKCLRNDIGGEYCSMDLMTTATGMGLGMIRQYLIPLNSMEVG